MPLTTIHTVCACGAVLQADRSQAGRAVRCRCGRVVTLPLQATRAYGAGWWGIQARRVQRMFRRWPLLPTPPWLFAWLAPLAWGWLGVVALGAMGLRWFGDDAWIPTVMLYGPRWLVLVPTVLLGAMALLLRPIVLVPALLTGVLSLTAVMGFHLGWPGASAGDAGTLRLITFNVEGGVNSFETAIPQNVEYLAPDVVVFQECTPALEDAVHLRPSWFGFRDGTQCIMSRFPIRERQRMEEVKAGDIGSTGAGVAYQIDTPLGPLRLANLHLETPRRALAPLRNRGIIRGFADNLVIREIGSERAKRWVATLGSDVVVAGDFNLVQESAIYRRHWSQCTNAFATVGRGFGYTRILHRFGARIDHVLACGHRWEPVSATTGPALGSDHRPLIVDLKPTPGSQVPNPKS